MELISSISHAYLCMNIYGYWGLVGMSELPMRNILGPLNSSPVPATVLCTNTNKGTTGKVHQFIVLHILTRFIYILQSNATE